MSAYMSAEGAHRLASHFALAAHTHAFSYLAAYPGPCRALTHTSFGARSLRRGLDGDGGGDRDSETNTFRTTHAHWHVFGIRVECWVIDDSQPAVNSTASNDETPAEPTPHRRTDYHSRRGLVVVFADIRFTFLVDAFALASGLPSTTMSSRWL
ncbi:hypothetical protein EDB92DRAFT_1816536 [Lactarius akahatsu]|uniref:Uncharacterized protein n=1 Tax=Lactarius akahatsu TaxID=416441 RepID=A0AAD4LEZ0_9AGAM|nr:hypothetical protein EDB92DRAFT_1816536 [Lactarius akahatsu]